MDSEKRLRVILAGGSGGVGQEICDALVSRGRSKITILTRKSPESSKPNPEIADQIRIVAVDYSNHEQLVACLRGADVVFSFILDYENKVQKRLIDACIAAKVKRFSPSEYVWANYSSIDLFSYKDATREYLEKINSDGTVLEYCLFQPGMFMNYLSFPRASAMHLYPSPIAVNVASCKALTLQGENPEITFTTVQDLARVTAMAIESTGAWPRIGQMCGTTTTLDGLIKLAEEIRGHQFDISRVTRQDLEQGQLRSTWYPEIVHSSTPPNKLEEVSRQLCINWLLAASRGSMKMEPTWNSRLPEFEPTQLEVFLREHFAAGG